MFADALSSADELELCDLIDKVDMVEALDAVEIALVDRVDAQKAGIALGAGLAPLADIESGLNKAFKRYGVNRNSSR